MVVKATTFENDAIQKSSTGFYRNGAPQNNNYALNHPKLIPKLKHLSISDSKKFKPYGLGNRGSFSALKHTESLNESSFYSSAKNSSGSKFKVSK